MTHTWHEVFWPRKPRIENDPKYVKCGRCLHYIQVADCPTHICVKPRIKVAP